MIRLIKSSLVISVLAGSLSGCASPLFAGLTLSEFTFASSLFSTAATGKGLGEHAMDVATGRDCNIMESLSRKGRGLCERKTSPVLEDDWKGLTRLADEDGPAWQSKRPEQEPRDNSDS